MDCVRAEDAYTSRLGYEEHIPGQVLPGPALPASPSGARLLLCTSRRLPPISVGLSAGRWKEKGIVKSGRTHTEPASASLAPPQTRDWNEELQTTRELPRKNLPERLLRERAIFKVTAFPF